jgi:lipopolysaccharide/colanic/teichoic acid biosynthesis glycosyltransferase
MRSSAHDRPGGRHSALSDRVAAGILLILLAPLLAVIALLLRLEGGRVLVREPRRSRTGREFRSWRFRTAAPGSALSPRPELGQVALPCTGAVGGFLETAGLENLPRLGNVMAGEVTLAEVLADLPAA